MMVKCFPTGSDEILIVKQIALADGLIIDANEIFHDSYSLTVFFGILYLHELTEQNLTLATFNQYAIRKVLTFPNYKL